MFHFIISLAGRNKKKLNLGGGSGSRICAFEMSSRPSPVVQNPQSQLLPGVRNFTKSEMLYMLVEKSK